MVPITWCPRFDDLLVDQESDFEGQFEDLALKLLIGGVFI
jgi:hypothetical protein